MRKPALWRCETCGRAFANRNQSHACGRHDLEHHFAGKSPEIRALYDRAARVITSLGKVKVLPEKTRIAFQVRMSFAQLTPRQRWIDGHVVLARRLEHPRFRQVQTFSPRNHLHTFRLESPSDVDEDFAGWMREAHAVGEQRHLAKNAAPSSREKRLTFDAVRRFGLSLPDVEEGTAYGTPALKLGGKLLACMAINKSAEPDSLVVRVDFDQRAELIAAEPEIYYVTDHYVDYSSVLVRLTRIRRDALEDLLQSSRRFVRQLAGPRPRRRSR